MGKRTIPRSAFAQHEERAEKIRKAVMSYIKNESRTDEPAIMLSSGADSHLVLFAALRLGKRPVVYSCTLADRESQDFVGARNTARLFGLKFVPVILPLSLKHLQQYVGLLYDERINPGLVVGKATAECTWPVAHMFKHINANRHSEVLMGFEGDIWYCTLRSQKKKYLVGKYNEIINQYAHDIKQSVINTDIRVYEGKSSQQVLRLNWAATFAPHIKRLIIPFHDPRLFKVMSGMDPIAEGCKPIQKAPWRLAFWEEFEKARASVYIHVPMQKGSSGIEEHFRKLLNTPLNTKGYRSTIGIYNDQLRLWRGRNE